MTSLRLNWWSRRPLAHRLLANSVALVLVMLLLLLGMSHALIRHQSEQQLQRELASAERVWHGVMMQEAARLHDASYLLAANHALLSALQRQDQPGMEAALALEGERMGAQITALLDPQFRLSATRPLDPVFLLWLKHSVYPDLALGAQSAGATAGAAPSWVQDAQALSHLLQSVAHEATLADPNSVLALLGGAPFQFVVAPVRTDTSGEPVAWVLLGFSLAQELAEDLHKNLGVHVSLLASNPERAPRLVFSTMSEPPALTHALPLGLGFIDSASERYAILHMTLPVWGGQMHTVLLRSQTQALAPFVHLQWGMLLFSVLVLLFFAWASWHRLRRLTQPLGDLQRSALALEQGRFDVPVAPACGLDDVSQLSRSFEAMRQSLEQQQAEIRRLAYRDRLTELPNRQRFVEAVEIALGQQAQGAALVSVLTLNLDRFKLVNEVMGYAFGDELLRAVARRLRESVTPEYLLARLGGDEFGVLMPQLTSQAALEQARGILGRLSAGVVLNGQRIDVRASLGLAEGPRDAQDADALVNRAEMAMRSAKRRTAGVLCFVPEHDRSQVADLSLLGAMRDGLERNELSLHLQPKLPLQPGRKMAAEALLRWQHPTEGMISPARFIPFAEQTGFISELTQWVLDRAMQTCAQWHSQNIRCSIAINVSARDLLHEGFAAQVARCLERNGALAEQISLEITESALMEDPARALTTLQQLSALGLELAIDDYGTGYSSLSYLKQLPVQTLKIDRAFVAELARDGRDAAIVQSTLKLAHQLGLKVVAEGVEDAATLHLLRTWGCDWAQGYHISKPLPLDQFPTWWAWQKGI